MSWKLSAIAFVLVLLFPMAPAQAAKVSATAQEAAQRQRSARVVVLLRTPAGAKRARLHPSTRRDVDAVLSKLPDRARGRVLRRFARVPAVVLEADAATLAALERHPAVARVDLDSGGSGHAVAPDQASVLNQVHQLAALGVGGAGSKIGIVDSGIDTDHADFRGRIVGQQCFCSVGTGCCPNGTASQSGNGAAEDDHGHGTNVAGIVGGDGTVAPRGALPQVSLVAVKVLDRYNRFQSTADVVAALDWLASQHPDIDAVNLSLGTDALFAGDCDDATAWTQALAIAIGNLNALGAVVTASSGNQGNAAAMGAPACIRDTVSTAATWDFSGGTITFLGCTEASTAPSQPTCFSNRSATTDLYAAGAFVTAPGFNGATSSYGGTSQAAPMVAACAVALKQAAPLATVAQRAEAMMFSPRQVLDPVGGRHYPLLDCRDALKLLDPQMFEPVQLEGAMPLIPPAGGIPSAPSAAAMLPSAPATEPRRRDRRRATPAK